MSQLFLIAHKVRGEPAFDVAVQMECPLCYGFGECPECDSTGFWWIIPTSGHRAFSYWYEQLDVLGTECGTDFDSLTKVMPESIPDHYTTRGEPRQSIDISALIPRSPPQRRF